MYKKPFHHDSWGNFLIFPRTWLCNTFIGIIIKLIKITIKYKKGSYTTDKHNLIIGIPLLQKWWRWHCYSHTDYICLNVHQVTFYYSALEAYISKTKKDRNKLISDSESWPFSWLRKGSHCTNTMHAQRDAQKHCFIYPCTTLRYPWF